MSDDRGDHRFDDDLRALRAIGARTLREPIAWHTPPDELWDRIATQVATPAAPPTVTPMRTSQRPSRRWLVPLTAMAAAAAAVVVAAGIIATRDDEPDVVAAVDLELLGQAGSGRAELVDADGTTRLRLETADLDAGDGFLEVWLIDPTVTKLVSLGPLRTDGLYDLPAGVTAGEFPIVDISIEPVDGDPTHSGNSILRGQLPA